MKEEEKDKYYVKYEKYWNSLVPKDGPADSLQGELLRAISRLQSEAKKNGNINWGKGFEIFVNQIRDTLISSKIFDDEQKNKINEDLNEISSGKALPNKHSYERLMFAIVDWCEANPANITYEVNGKQYL